MKDGIKAYFSFNRTERLGVVALVSLLLLLIVIKATMHLWVKPEVDHAEETRLRTAWQEFKSKPPAINVPKDDKVETAIELRPAKDTAVYKKSKAPQAALFEFNPNTVDSATLRKLGLREKTTSIFLHWRAKGKVFRKKEELRKVYTLTEEEYQRLEPYIVIP